MFIHWMSREQVSLFMSLAVELLYSSNASRFKTSLDINIRKPSTLIQNCVPSGEAPAAEVISQHRDIS